MVIKKIVKGLKYPTVYFNQLIHEINYDYLAITKKVKYKNHLIFVAGLPKSGTTWLEKLISEIPGYIMLNGSFLRKLKGVDELDHNHGINNKMINSAPPNKYSFLKRHTHYNQKYIRILDKAGVKPVILIRDIRDMLISRYFHVLADPYHWQHQSINSLPLNEGFEKSLFEVPPDMNVNVVTYYKNWINDWLIYDEHHSGKSLVIRYEDMRHDIFDVFKRFLIYYEFEFSDEFIRKMINNQKRKQIMKSDLSKNIYLPEYLKTTFRSGKIGEWKNLLSKDNKMNLKNLVGDILIKSGYEKDQNWV